MGGENHLKQMSCAESAVVELGIAKSFLTEEKQKGLEPELAQLTALRDKIKEGEPSPGVASRLRQDVERQKIRIEKRFSYSKTKDYIK